MSKEESFIKYVMERVQVDTGYRAALRRANNPRFEIYAWEYIMDWNIDPELIICYVTVAAVIAQNKIKQDGSLSVGKALNLAFKKTSEKDEGSKIRFFKLLSSKNRISACKRMQQCLSLIEYRKVNISYNKLLNDLIYFGDKVKKQWALDYYRKDISDDNK